MYIAVYVIPVLFFYFIDSISVLVWCISMLFCRVVCLEVVMCRLHVFYTVTFDCERIADLVSTLLCERKHYESGTR